MVESFAQDHLHRQPLVAMPLTETALTPPLGGSRSVFSHGGRPLKAQKRVTQKLCNLVELWVLVVVVVRTMRR